MTLDLDTQVGALVLARPDLMRYLESQGVDYCCGGHRSLREACEAAGRSPQEVMAGLLAQPTTTPGTEPPIDWRMATLVELMAHLEATHHAFLRAELPRLEKKLEQVLEAHAGSHPELDEVFDLFQELSLDLMPHLLKEEQILFPFIRALETGAQAQACFGTVQSPIRVMEAEHEAVGGLLVRLRACTAGYQAPADGCATFRAFYEGLAALEADLHLHIFLENQVLHPRATALEAARQL